MTPTQDVTPAAAAPPATPKRKSRFARFARFALYGLLALAVILALSHVLWNRSGSNAWELAMDKEGVKVWTMKTPGTDLVRIKAATRIKSSLAGMVKLLEDLESCVDAKCYDASVIQPIATMPNQYAAFVQFKFDIPGLKTREYVLLQEHIQDPVSKKLDINIIAAPNRIPRDACCVRITHLHNHWTLTPLKNGELDIEFMQDTDIGGLPYFLANPALTYGTHEILLGMQGLMNMAKYRDARLANIQELSAD
ncbi:hypothetical protein HF313_20035 [Massilia atriviolacea]|uniref:START domain-containing protein n=1 Tax=Massilia atriviolacea TaxID=2495579 RepID=A0A430HS88_9BURK|nr:hypothetical protein [Massilia atriviolacea]RSZ60411.1 hypothetical protein EJB06_04665 [Massilia atriviolacea]